MDKSKKGELYGSSPMKGVEELNRKSQIKEEVDFLRTSPKYDTPEQTHYRACLEEEHGTY